MLTVLDYSSYQVHNIIKEVNEFVNQINRYKGAYCIKFGHHRVSTNLICLVLNATHIYQGYKSGLTALCRILDRKHIKCLIGEYRWLVRIGRETG